MLYNTLYILSFQTFIMNFIFAAPVTQEISKDTPPLPSVTISSPSQTGKWFTIGSLVGALSTIALGAGIITPAYTDVKLQKQRQEQAYTSEREILEAEINVLQDVISAERQNNAVSPKVLLPSYASTGVQHVANCTSISTQTSFEFDPEGAQREKLALEEELSTARNNLEEARANANTNLALYNAKQKENSDNIDDYNSLVKRYNALLKELRKSEEEVEALIEAHRALQERYDKKWF